MKHKELNAILFEREPGVWVGQYLEYDLGAQAGTLPDLMYEMQKSLIGYAVICADNDIAPFCDLQSAPQPYWDMWNRARMALTFEAEPFRTAENVQRPHIKSMKLAEAQAA